jgi:hypothetical protein
VATDQAIAGLPPLTLDAGCTITIEAISPTTGAAVTGVTVSQVTIYADNAVNTAAAVERTPMYALETLE